MEYVIIRPPLVYGPNCPGNFLALLMLVSRNLPLPLGMINNKRSLIGVDNLADFLTQCIQNSEARNKTFLISDDSDISTPELIRTLAEGMHQKPFMLSVPYQLLLALTALIGKSSALEKLCGNLQVDASFARKTLNWKQPVTQSQGLKEVASWYVSSRLGSK
jgi:nucleoside-diphosphate-sugar epimerase